jgi:ketol-acid reductoisomerase
MRKILKEIQSGKFARQWIRENDSGAKNFRRLLKDDLRHPIERVGEKLRARMPWLKGAR